MRQKGGEIVLLLHLKFRIKNCKNISTLTNKHLQAIKFISQLINTFAA